MTSHASRDGCDLARKGLRAWFDEGAALDEGVEAHVAGCFACRRYRDQLQQLDEVFLELPLHVPSDGFESRVSEALRRLEPTPRPERPWKVAAGAVVAFVLTAVLNWFYPLPLNAEGGVTWLENQWLALRGWDWAGVGEGLATWATQAWSSASAGVAGLVHVPPVIVWASMGAVLLFLIVFNSIEVRREQTHGLMKRG